MELECLCLQVSKNIIGKNVASCLYPVYFLDAVQNMQSIRLPCFTHMSAASCRT